VGRTRRQKFASRQGGKTEGRSPWPGLRLPQCLAPLNIATSWKRLPRVDYRPTLYTDISSRLAGSASAAVHQQGARTEHRPMDRRRARSTALCAGSGSLSFQTPVHISSKIHRPQAPPERVKSCSVAICSEKNFMI